MPSNNMEEFIDSQKIIYELKPSKERNVSELPEGCEEFKILNDKEYTKIDKIPFVRLLNGKEPLVNVKIRYSLYKKNWDRQLRAINGVLSKTDRFKFRSLREFLSNDDKTTTNDNCRFDSRLTTALLNLGSNISNHDRLLNNVCKYLREDDKVCLVKINPNVCFNIQRIMRRIEDSVAYKVHEIIENKNKGITNKRRNTKNKRRRIINDNDNNEVVNINEEEESDEDEFNYELNNEFDLLPEKIEKDKYVDLEDLLQVFKKDNIKLIVLIQNADAMSSSLIEQTLMTLHKFNLISEVYGIIGISTPFIIFQEKVSKLLIGKLKTKKFAIDNSNEAINQIMEDLLLNINETYNSLIFDPKLVLKFLYKRDIMSIQQFNNYMKLIYMRHYFSQPLSLFWTNDFSKIDLHSIYFKIFKTLPSVIENSNEIEKKYLYGIVENDVQKIGELLRINLNKLINWRFNFRNLIDFLNFAQASILENKIWFNNLELFQLLFEKYYELRDNEEIFDDDLFKDNENDNNEEEEDILITKEKENNKSIDKRKFSNSKINHNLLTDFLTKLWDKIRELPNDRMESFYYQLKKDEQFQFISKNFKFPKKCPIDSKRMDIFIESIKLALRDQVCELDLDNQAFREICVVREDAIRNIHDSFEPCVRENSLKNLDEPGKILFNSRHWVFNNDNESKKNIKVEDKEDEEIFETKKNEQNELNKMEDELKDIDIKMHFIIEPILCEMYRIFKETGIIVNIYDFYQVFKNSLVNRIKLIELMRIKLNNQEFIKKFKYEEIDKMKNILDNISTELNNGIEDEWDKLTLAWFLKSLSEFQLLGLVKEGNSKSQSIEKIVWRGI